jgi:hypothetical protein
MNEKAFFDKVIEAIEQGLSQSHEHRWTDLYNFYQLTCENPQSLSSEQQNHLLQQAIEILNNGGQYAVIYLSGIIAYGGAPKPSPYLETTIVYDAKILPLHPRSEFVHPFEIAVETMRKANVFTEGEEIIIYEAGRVSVNKNEGGKRGVLVLTNKRILCLGDHLRGDMLFYDDYEQRPFVWSMDIIDIKKLKEINEKKECIEAKYDTKYFKSRKIPIYHPLFQFDIHLKPKLKEGTVKIFIDMTTLGPDKKTIRADKKRRTHEFYTRIMQLLDSEGPRPE